MYAKVQNSDLNATARRKPHILDVLRGSHRFQATDERDRVYSVVGMTNTPTRSTSDNQVWPESPSHNQTYLPVSYEKTISEVFQDVVKYCINADSSLAIISFNSPSRKAVTYGAKDIQLPTWAIDWRQTSDEAALRSYLPRLRESTIHSRPLQQYLHRPHLHLKGLRVGQIELGRADTFGIRFNNRLSEIAADLKMNTHTSLQVYPQDVRL